MIVYVSIGNSDDKLSQAQWSRYVTDVQHLWEDYFPDLHLHGEWFSSPQSFYQNACWCIDFVGRIHQELVENLRTLAAKYHQESIAWAEVPETIFIEP